MNYKKLMGIALALSFVTLVACSGVTQKPAESNKAEGAVITVKGKIAQYMGHYYVKEESPPQEYLVVNGDPKLLDGFLKSGKTITIEGRLSMGADRLFIEKIDGQPYRGK